MADKAISDRGKAGGAAKPASTPNGTKATQPTNAVTGRAGQPPKGAPSSPPPVGAAAVKAVTQGARLKGNVALGGSANPGAPGGKPLPSVPARPSASPAAANGPRVRGAAAGGPGDQRPHGEATPAGASGKPADPGVKVKQVAQAANEINQALQQVGADEAREAVADSQKNLAQGILDGVRKGLTGHANDGQRNLHDTRERLEQLHDKVLSGAITAEQARQGLNETMRGYGAEAQRVNAGRVQALEVGASAVEATRNAAETTATMTATTLAGPVGGTVVGTFVRDLNKAAYELSAEAHDVPAPRQSLMRYGVDVVRGQKFDDQTRQQVLQSFGQSVVSSAVDAAVGRYSTGRTAGLMQSGTGAMRAAAVAQTEAQLLFRGSQAVGQAALEAAQDPDMTLRQKAEHVGQAALSQVASLPFTYLGAGLGIGLDSGQTLTSAGRQMLGDAATGLADQATSTWLLEGRGLKGSEIAGTLTGSAVGGLNNFSQHPRTRPAAAAGADSHQSRQTHQSRQSRQSHLPDLTGIDPQRQGQHIVDAMDSAIARHDQTGDPSDLNAVLGWANANAGAGSRKQWDRSHLQDYVRLGAEINRRIANPAAPAGQATPPAADGAPGVGGLSATPSSVVRAERELQQRERLQPVRAEIDRTGQANSAAPDAHTEPASRTQHAPHTAQPPAQPPAPETSTAANHDPLLDIVRGQLAAPELRQLIELSNQDLASEHARRARDELAENAVVAMAGDGFTSADAALAALGLPTLGPLETDARFASMSAEPLLTLPNGRPLPLSSRQAIENFFLAYADLDPATARRRAAEVPLVSYSDTGAAKPLNPIDNGRAMFEGENRLFRSTTPLPEDLIGYNTDGSTKAAGLYVVVGGAPSVPWSEMNRIVVDGKPRVPVFIVVAGNAEKAGPNTFERGNPFSLLYSRPQRVDRHPEAFPFSPIETLWSKGWTNIYGIDVKNPSDHSALDVVHERADAEKIKLFVEWAVNEELFSAWLADPDRQRLRDELSRMTDAERGQRLSEVRREFRDEVTVVLAGHSYGGTLALHAHHLLRVGDPELVGVVMPFGAALRGIPGCAVSAVGTCAGSDPQAGSFGFAPIEQNPFLEEIVATFMSDPGKHALVFSAGNHDFVMGNGGSEGQKASFLPVEMYPVDPTSEILQFDVGSGPLAPDLAAVSRVGPYWAAWMESGVPPPQAIGPKFWADSAAAFVEFNRAGVDPLGGDAGGTGHMRIFENSAPLWTWLLDHLEASPDELSRGVDAARWFLDVRRHEAGSPLAAQTPPVTDQPPGPSGSTAGAQQSSESVRRQRELARRGEGERLYETLTAEQRDAVQQLLARRMARGELLDPLAAVQAVRAVAGARTESAAAPGAPASAARQPPDPRQTPVGGPDPEPPPTPKGRADGWVEYHDLVGTQPELRSLLDQALDLLRQGQSVEVEVQEVGSMLAQGESVRKSRRFEGPDASSELVSFVLTAIESETQDVYRIKLTSDAGAQDVFANAIGPVPFLLRDTDRSVIDAQAVSDFMVRAFVMGVGRRVADTLLGMDGAQRTRVLARALDESGGASQRKSWITLLAALHAVPQPAALVERLDSPERFRIAVELIDYVKATLPAAADHRLIEGFLDLPPSEQERVFKALARIGLEEADRTEVAAPLIWGLAARAADPTIPADSPVPDPQARLEQVGTRYEIMTRAVTAWLDRRPDALDRTYPTRDAAALAAADLLGEFNRQQIQMGAEPGASAGRPVFEGLLIIYYDSASDTYLLSPPVVGNSKTVAHEQIAPGGRRAILRADDGAIDLTAGLALAGYVHSHPGREGEVGFSLGDLGAAGDLGGVAYVVETLPGVHAADATSSVLLKLDANARDVPLVTVVEEAGALPGFASQLPRGIRLRNEWD